MNAYLNAMRHYFDFKGQATRSKFWLFILVSIILAIIAAVLDDIFDLGDGEALVFTRI